MKTEQKKTEWHLQMDKDFQSRMHGDTSVVCSVKKSRKRLKKKKFRHLFIHLQSAHNERGEKGSFVEQDSWNKCAETLNADIFSMLRVEKTSQTRNE